MPQMIVSTIHTVDRFIQFSAPTRPELIEQLNATREGMASVIAFGQDQDGVWYAVFDRALQVILTMDDVTGMQENQENDLSIDVELENYKTVKSA